jgi:hypothetical protein
MTIQYAFIIIVILVPYIIIIFIINSVYVAINSVFI